MFSAIVLASFLSAPAHAGGAPSVHVDLAAGARPVSEGAVACQPRVEDFTSARGWGASGALPPDLFQCLPPEGALSGTLELSITVGCGDRVGSVEVLSEGGLPPAVVACVEDGLTSAPLPARGLQPGERFLYPIHFNWPG